MVDPTEVWNRVQIDFKLTDKQRAIVAANIQGEFFDIIQRMMEDEVGKFNTALMNTPTWSDNIKGAHALAQAAAQFYVGLMASLSDQVNLERYNAARLGTPANPENPTAVPEFGGGDQYGERPDVSQ